MIDVREEVRISYGILTAVARTQDGDECSGNQRMVQRFNLIRLRTHFAVYSPNLSASRRPAVIVTLREASLDVHRRCLDYVWHAERTSASV